MRLLDRPARATRWLAALTMLGALSGCLFGKPPSLEQAVSGATDTLLDQTRNVPALLAKLERTVGRTASGPKSQIVIDPMLDTSTGQQTTATTLIEKRVIDRTQAKFEQFEFLPFHPAHLSKAQYLLTGTMTRVASEDARRVLRINLALTDLRSGLVVAQSTALADDSDIDTTPLRYYSDSPVLIKDKVIEGYARTTASPPGIKADAHYLARIAASAKIKEATALYNAERYQEALGQYRDALATPEGEQLRTLSGIYVSNVKLGRLADAEKAFAQVVALGFAYNELGVKFLFNPGSTEFWSDARISGAYAMWLRQIARESVNAKACLDIVGHTSRSGTAPANETLSLRRAVYVRQRLTSEAASLGPRTRATGMGYAQNIVGSGTDNAIDVLDRRVEFKIIPCS